MRSRWPSTKDDFRLGLMAIVVFGVPMLHACGGNATASGPTSSSASSSGGQLSSTSQSSGTGQAGRDAGNGGAGAAVGGIGGIGQGGDGGSAHGGEGGSGAGGMGAAGGDHLFSRFLDNAGTVRLAAADLQGSLLLTGQAEPFADFGSGPLPSTAEYALFVTKYDAMNSVVFAKMFGDGVHAGNDIAPDANAGLVVVGMAGAGSGIDFGGGPLPSSTQSDAVVARLDGSGNELWAKRFVGAETSYALGVTVSPGNDVYVVGSASLWTIDFGGGPLTIAGTDAFVAKFDASGNHLWSFLRGDAWSQSATDVALDSSGSVYVTGVFEGTIDFSGPTLTSAGGYDIFLVKLDASGNHMWSKSFGDPSLQYCHLVRVDSSGNVLLVGYHSGTVDYGGGPLTSTSSTAFLARFDTNGTHLSSALYSGLADVSLDPAGNLVLVGGFQGSIDFGGGPLLSNGYADVFVAKLTPTGSHIWSKSFGSALNQSGSSVSAEGPSVALVGSFQGGISLGGATFHQTGPNQDGFFARLAH